MSYFVVVTGNVGCGLERGRSPSLVITFYHSCTEIIWKITLLFEWKYLNQNTEIIK